MDIKHQYEMILNKSGLLIELSSDDVYFITKQMDKWFRIFLDKRYIPAPLPVAPSAQKPQIILQPRDQEPQEQRIERIESFEPQSMAVNELEGVAGKINPAIELRESGKLAMPFEKPSFSSREVALQPKDDFETVMDSLMEDLGTSAAPAVAVALSQQPVMRQEAPQAEEKELVPDFIQNAVKAELPNFKPRPSLETIDSLSDLCKRGYAGTPEDFLLLSAYYLTFFEAVDKFSLKRINSLMVKTGLTPVNHSVLETAIDKGFLSMVPDLTGLADVTEYALTESGQRSAERLL